MIPVNPSIDGQNQLISQYQTATKFRAATGAFLKGFDPLEAASQELLNQLDPFQADGIYLDFAGLEVGLVRGADDTGAPLIDTTYAALIFAKGAANRWRGDHETAVATVAEVVNNLNALPFHMPNDSAYSVLLFDSGERFLDWQISGPPSDVFGVGGERTAWRTAIEMFVPLGVRLRSVTWYYPNAPSHYVFGFPDSQGFFVHGVDMDDAGLAIYFAEDV